MINAQIIAAAELIAELDPPLARAFIAQPFNRSALVTAFHHSLKNSRYTHLADHISATLRSVIDSTKPPA